ncbi:MAG: hypothetical protein FAZ92_01080 [Accumulibacter sp.]|nr:MAG: hypothetical protein FAZ92_01080 [Accumulibacter sp.]
MPIATGVRIDAAAALVTRLVTIAVVTAKTMTTSSTLPPARRPMASARTVARPLSTTMAPSATDPTRMNSTFQSRARTADFGVRMPVTTIRTAPVSEASSTGTRPKDAETMTETRMARANAVFAGCGLRPAAFSKIATSGWSTSRDLLGVVTNAVAPGRTSVSRKGMLVRAAMTRMPPSVSKSRTVPLAPEPTDTR